MPEVNTARALRRISAGKYKFPRQRESVLASALKHERTCIREHRGVEASGDHWGNCDSCFPSQAVDHFRSGNRLRVNPIDVSKLSPTQVMINVDEKLLLQPLQPGALDAVTFQDDGSIVISVHPIRFHHGIGKGQRLVDAWNTVVQNNIGVFAHGAQNLAAS